MTRRILLALALIMLIGCSPQIATNRIYRSRPTATVIVPSGRALAVEISQLQQAPEAYRDVLVRVTSQYRRAPLIICDGIVRQSPATWRLGVDEQLIGAGGSESLVPTLLPPRMTITVEGVWRTWRGPVGCGKDAPQQTVWYLAVTRVVSPSPIARVTLTPPGGVPGATPDQVVEEPLDTATPSGPPALGTPASAPSATSRPTATAADIGPQATATQRATQAPSFSPTPDEGDDEDTPEPTDEAQATATVIGGATATSGATPTPSTTPTVGATPTPGGSVVDKGSIGYQDLRGGRLGAGETNSWQFPVQAGDVITVSVAGRAGSDIALSVLDPAGNRIIEQNDSPAGQIEVIEGLEAAGSGGYRLVISEAGGVETYYSVMLLNTSYADYYTFIFAGLLSYGSTVTSDLAPDTDQFWFFFGNDQELINISVAPNDQSDLFFDLFGPEGDIVWEYVDETRNGGAEQLRDLRLPATGMYAIRVGEIDYEASSFRVLVSRN